MDGFDFMARTHLSGAGVRVRPSVQVARRPSTFRGTRSAYDIGTAMKAADTIVRGTRPTALVTQRYVRYSTSEVPLSTIVDYYKTNVKFRLAVYTYMARSVGAGYYNTADTTTTDGKKALETADQWGTDWDLDTKNQLGARDVWMSGNWFLNRVARENRLLDGIYNLPLSSFIRIDRDDYGSPVNFVQSWGGVRNVEPKDILHFRWLPIDEDAFGEGVGQILARTGLGYINDAGNRIVRRSWFETSERIDDMVPRMVEAGMPRYFANFPTEDADFVDEARNALNSLDVLQHFVVNAEGKIETIALDTQSKFDGFIRYVDDQITTGTQSPLIRLWSSLDFTYASSEQAIKAMEPSIDMYQRAHKQFVHINMYRPLMLQDRINPKIAKLEMHLGKQEKLKLQEIATVWNILKDPKFDGRYDPSQILKLLQENGVEIDVIEQDVINTGQFLSALDEVNTNDDARELVRQVVAKIKGKKTADRVSDVAADRIFRNAASLPVTIEDVLN